MSTPVSVAPGPPPEMAAPGLLARVREGLADHRDPVFTDLGATGELLVAQVRVLLTAILFTIQLIPGSGSDTRPVTLPLTLVALVLAFLFYFLASRRPQPWMQGFASSGADVTLVSCGLAAFLLLDQPHVAVNGSTLFEVYFLVIACASLRYNPQACAWTGLVAIAQYATIVGYAVARWNLNDARYAPFKYGTFDWHMQGTRLILLGAAALVGAFIVLRAQNLRQLSDTDRLTGAANRRAFDERLDAEVSRAQRYHRPLAIAVIDIDHFKRVNDSRGHAAGDAVLRAVAGMLTRSMRKSDLVARLGGDEFVILLPETTAELVMDRLERICREVAAARIAVDVDGGAEPVRITLSIGVANWPDDGNPIQRVLSTADSRLYEAKQQGRDRIVGMSPAPRAAVGASDPVARG